MHINQRIVYLIQFLSVHQGFTAQVNPVLRLNGVYIKKKKMEHRQHMPCVFPCDVTYKRKQYACELTKATPLNTYMDIPHTAV